MARERTEGEKIVYEGLLGTIAEQERKIERLTDKIIDLGSKQSVKLELLKICIEFGNDWEDNYNKMVSHVFD